MAAAVKRTGHELGTGILAALPIILDISIVATVVSGNSFAGPSSLEARTRHCNAGY